MSSIKNFIFVLTLIFSVANIKCEENEDLFVIFTQQFTATQCYKEVNQKTPICDKPKNPWLISEFLHQLPNDPSFVCINSVEKLDPTIVSTATINELGKKWRRPHWLTDPSVAAKRIWRDFGGCTSKISEINNATKYFNKSFELHEKYNLNNILSEANITPGNNYTAKQISDAVSSATGRKVLLRCTWNFVTDENILEMITIYLDKSFKPIDAVKHDHFATSECSSDKPILYEDEKVDTNAGKMNYDVQDFTMEETLKLSKSEEKLYGDPAVKYPTLSEDDNGYYIFEQRLNDFDCFKDDVSQCALPKYPWHINSLTYEFNQDIEFDCETNSDNFDPKNISSIQDELFEKWNNKMDDVAEAFGFRWAYGARCSAYFKGLDSPFKFYKKSIELFDKYNMDVILRESNIIPGNNYTFQAIADAVSKGLQGTKADIKCSRGFGEKIYDLMNIKIYFDQSFNPINKTRDHDNTAVDCPLDENIRYKNFIPSVKPTPLFTSFDYPTIF